MNLKPASVLPRVLLFCYECEDKVQTCDHCHYAFKEIDELFCGGPGLHLCYKCKHKEAGP